MHPNFTGGQVDSSLKIAVTGTTTVGVICRDGVILGADRRVTAGHYIVHKKVKKIFKLDEHLAATMAGVVADAQQIMEVASSNIKLYRYSTGVPIKVKSAATLLSNILAGARLLPYIVQVLVGGVDVTGPRLFSLDPFGSLTEETFIATGSGSPAALGVLEDAYKPEMSVDEALKVVVRAIKAAMKRDPASGEGFDLVVITREGCRELPCEQIEG
ncbi:MAG: proteasome endopeptidase complex, archaeal, beta subunit [Candidatus Methanomethylicota archaeon]|nr:MAG: proteasome endopeptidase complex, archaeal, beta subunit [Candidatus Verstraetearchaeota archaeon]